MTSVIEEQAAADGRRSAGGLGRIAAFLVLVVVVESVWLGALLLGTSPLAADAEIEALVNGYVAAFETNDIEGLRAVVTGDFTVVEQFDTSITRGWVPVLDEIDLDGIALMLDQTRTTMDLVRRSDLVVTGEGPWFVADVEEWTEGRRRIHQASVYLVVEDAGELQIGRKWVVGAELGRAGGGGDA